MRARLPTGCGAGICLVFDYEEIESRGVPSTPGLVIDGVVASFGPIRSSPQIGWPANRVLGDSADRPDGSHGRQTHGAARRVGMYRLDHPRIDSFGQQLAVAARLA